MARQRKTSLAERQAAMRAKFAPPVAGSLREVHYDVRELAEILGVSPDWVRRRFRAEPGVLKIGGLRCRLRIPESVAERVYRELSQ